MSRFFMCGNLRRASKSFVKNQSSDSGLGKHGAYEVLFMPQYRLSSLYRSYHRECMHSPMYKIMHSTTMREFSRSYSAPYASNSMTLHAQTTWRRLSQMCSCNSVTASPIGRFAQAFSLASTRSHIVISGLLTLIFGKLARAQTACADSSYYPSRNTVYMHAEDGHAYLTYLLSEVLEFLLLLLRTFYLTILFSPCIVMAPFADTFGIKFRRFWLHIVHQTLEQAGPAFIKWGQWAATRPDLFPTDLCAELAKLHSDAPKHTYAYTKRTVEKAFGRKLTEIFERFEEIPIASGSIAQVHRASLRFRYPGKKTAKLVDVAVKVRHPGVGESIRRDFVIINAVAKISTLIPTLKWLRLDESVQQFAVFMMSQVDLSREAANLSRFIYNFRRWRDVSFPKPLYPLVHPAVLVETYEQGESVAHYIDDFQGHERFKAALAHIGTHALLKMLLVDNFIHADMHPGNILVREADTRSRQKRLQNSRPHVVFIDVGMTAELSKNDRVNLIDFFKAVALRDGQTAAECTLRLSKRQNCPNPDAFIKEVKESFDFWGTEEGDLVHPADCMHHLLEQVRRHRVNVDGNVCTVIVTTLVLEGWQRKLDPDYDVMKTLQTMLFKADWAKSISYTIEGLMAP